MTMFSKFAFLITLQAYSYLLNLASTAFEVSIRCMPEIRALNIEWLWRDLYLYRLLCNKVRKNSYVWTKQKSR